MKKRVLQFIGSFHQGGSERQAVALSRMLKGDGTFDVRVATLNNEGVLKPHVDALGLGEIPEFRLTSFYTPSFVRQARRCAEWMRDNHIDIVHTHDFYTNIFGMAAAGLARVPVKIASKRETGGMRSPMQKVVERMAFRRADAVVANSNAVRQHLVSARVPSEKIRVICNGIERRPQLPSNGKDGSWPLESLPADARLITLVANLRHSVKNVPMLLRTAKRVVEHDETAHFVIAGEGELRDELQGLAVRLGVARNVHFIGRCDDVPALLTRSYAGVLTSTAEGFSNSLIEYMAAGKPVVATDVGGAGEAVIDGETGYLVESDDDAAMAGSLIDLLHDEKKAAAFGSAGRESVERRFSQAVQLAATLDLYRSLLENH